MGKSAGPETSAARRPYEDLWGCWAAGDARSYVHSLGGSGATAGIMQPDEAHKFPL